MKLSDLPGIRSQRDPQWANIELGFNIDPEFNLGHYGCLITSMANYIWAIDRANESMSNPGLLNNAMKNMGGFEGGGGNVNWAGFNQRIDARVLPQGVTSDIHTLADWLNGDNHYALIQVTGSHAGYTFPQHWLMGYGVTEGTGAPDALDPWFGDACEVQGRYTFVLAHLYGDGQPLTPTAPVPPVQAAVQIPVSEPAPDPEPVVQPDAEAGQPDPAPAPGAAPAASSEPESSVSEPSLPPVHITIKPVEPTNPAPTPTLPAVNKESKVKVTPKWHQVLAGVAVAMAVLGQLAGQLDAMQTVTSTGLLAVLLGLVEKL